MNNNSLGCGKRFKRISGKHKEVIGDCDFICGVPDGWGKETLCFDCDKKLKDSWADDDRKIENIHKKNFKLIRKHKLRVGSRLKLVNLKYISDKTQMSTFNLIEGAVYRVEFIHPLYGWVLFQGSANLPQTAEDLFNCCEVLKGGNKDK